MWRAYVGLSGSLLTKKGETAGIVLHLVVTQTRNQEVPTLALPFLIMRRKQSLKPLIWLFFLLFFCHMTMSNKSLIREIEWLWSAQTNEHLPLGEREAP